MRGNLRGELDKSTIMVGDFHRPLSNRTNRQKISEDIEELHHLIHQIIDIYRTLHPGRAEPMFFKCPGHIHQDRPCPGL